MRIPNPVLVLATCLLGTSADAQTAALTVLPARPEAGAIVRLTLRPAAPTESVTAIGGMMAGEPLHFRRGSDGMWHAIGAVPVDAGRRVVASAFIHREARVDTLTLTVPVPPPPPARTEPLKVDTGFTQKPDSALEARIARENERARDVGRRAHETPPLWTAAFMRPRTSRLTSTFGRGRVFNGAVTTRHLGVDFAGAVGEPIRAANRGVVALVDTFFLAGHVVYIDHGGGLVTGYFHMSKQLVAEGDTVSRGQIIGLVGATGRVTGPHLHWTARYGTVTVNAMDLLPLRVSWFGKR